MHELEIATVTLIERRSDFDRLGPEWNLLMQDSRESSPFLAWPWIRAWWQSFAGDSSLFVFACRDGNGRLLGVAPLLIARRKAFGAVRVRTVEFIGNVGSAVCTDHLDFLVLPDLREEVTAQLMGAVMEHRARWDVLSLGSVAPHSAIPAALKGLTASGNGVLKDNEDEVCPWIDLPDSWDGFVEVMKREHKSLISNLRRKRNRLNANHKVEFLAGDAVGDPVAHVETLSQLHRLARMRQGGEGNFGIQEYRSFHEQAVREMHEAGNLYLSRLDIDGEPAAAWYGFYVKPVLSYYQSGFDTKYIKEGVGDVLLGMILEDAITRLGARGFDFLRGTEEYKFRWTSQTRVDRTVRYWQPSAMGTLGRTEFDLRKKASAWKRKWRESREKKAPAQTTENPPQSES